MSLIDDLTAEINSYDTDKCETEIVAFQIDGGGTELDVGETFKFRIRVKNQGHLDMERVRVRAYAISPYTLVRKEDAHTWGSHATGGYFNLAAHQTFTTGFFRGKAETITNGVKTIVRAKL